MEGKGTEVKAKKGIHTDKTRTSNEKDRSKPTETTFELVEMPREKEKKGE